MNKKTAEDITFGVVLAAIGLAIMLLCGCAGTKYANSANSHELAETKKATAELEAHIDKTNPNAVHWFNQLTWRIGRMLRLQGARNQYEGMANVSPSDDLLPVAIMKLREQGLTAGTAWGILNAVGGSVFGSYWKEIIGLLMAAGVVGIEEYHRRKNKKLAVANTQAIEAYGAQNPDAEVSLKNYQRYYMAKNSGTDKLIQAAAAGVRADMADERS